MYHIGVIMMGRAGLGVKTEIETKFKKKKSSDSVLLDLDWSRFWTEIIGD